MPRLRLKDLGCLKLHKLYKAHAEKHLSVTWASHEVRLQDNQLGYQFTCKLWLKGPFLKRYRMWKKERKARRDHMKSYKYMVRNKHYKIQA